MVATFFLGIAALSLGYWMWREAVKWPPEEIPVVDLSRKSLKYGAPIVAAGGLILVVTAILMMVVNLTTANGQGDTTLIDEASARSVHVGAKQARSDGSWLVSQPFDQHLERQTRHRY